MNVWNYLLTVVALVVSGEMIRLILPNGKTKKTAETVFALVVVLCLITPVASFFKGTGEKDTIVSIDPEKTFVNETYADGFKDLMNRRVKRCLEAENVAYSGYDIEWEGNSVKKIKIYLSDLVMDDDFEHIIGIEEREKLETLLGVGKGAVEIVRR